MGEVGSNILYHATGDLQVKEVVIPLANDYLSSSALE